VHNDLNSLLFICAPRTVCLRPGRLSVDTELCFCDGLFVIPNRRPGTRLFAKSFKVSHLAGYAALSWFIDQSPETRPLLHRKSFIINLDFS
jgi:hypothetical protein